MASGAGQPHPGPGRIPGSLARHRWITAAGMTATVAAVAGGGLILALHDGSRGAHQHCGLVPCAAALPESVRSGAGTSGGAGSASAPATAGPAATDRAPAPSPSAPAGLSRSGPSAPATAREIAANGSSAVSGWRIRVVLPRDAGYQVLRHRGHRGSATAGPPASAGTGQPQPARSGHGGWPGSWLDNGGPGGAWPDGRWSGGGWPNGGWPSRSWGGQDGRGYGWPGGR